MEPNTKAMEWRPVVGMSGYLVSDTGLIKSLKKKHLNKLVSQMNNQQGYKRLYLCDLGIKRRFFVHRAVAEAFVPNPEGHKYVNHIDGDKTNNDSINLEWCSSGDNQRHAYRTGLKPKVTPNAKITKHDADSIRLAFRAGQTREILCATYDLSRCNINKILNHQLWR